jgi:hypothetical protein
MIIDILRWWLDDKVMFFTNHVRTIEVVWVRTFRKNLTESILSSFLYVFQVKMTDINAEKVIRRMKKRVEGYDSRPARVAQMRKEGKKSQSGKS